uniref:Odorant receptor n=1 Tax=Streltzoviella insularis TaxID=1206366 RepID=A0A7D5UML8_9NEOP|nr:odorant receptor 17 [Streltzoviella insularis]
MVKTLTERLEDPERPFLGPHYWLTKKIGLFLPKSKLGIVTSYVIHEIVTYFVVTQYIELYKLIVLKADVDILLFNVRSSMLSVVCIVKSNSFLYWQSKWHDLFEYVTETDKFERETQDEVRVSIINNYTNYCRRITNVYWSLVIFTNFTVIFTPLMKYMTLSDEHLKAIENGTEMFPHVFSAWTPFIDKEHSPGCWITILYHAIICSLGTLMVISYDMNAVVIMVFFGGKLLLFRERCKQLFDSDEAGLSDEEVRNRIRDLHLTYVRLVKYFNLFNSLLSPVMFLYVVMCSLVLCASIYQLTSSKDTMMTKFIMAQYFIFASSQLFLFCWHSNDVLAISEIIMYGPYDSKWWAASVRQRKYVLLLIGQLRKDFTFTAGPFTDLTLSTFIAILKGAYSYYTLVRD